MSGSTVRVVLKRLSLGLAILTLLAFGPWMLKKLLAFSTAVIANVPAYF